MSSLSEQDPLNPNDQLYYAPRWLRERSEPVPPLPSPVPSPSAEKNPRALRALTLIRLPTLSTLCWRKRLPSRCAIRSTPR